MLLAYGPQEGGSVSRSSPRVSEMKGNGENISFSCSLVSFFAAGGG